MKTESQMNQILKLENQLCFPLYAGSRLIVQSYEHELDKFNLTYPQYLVLLVLWENDGLGVKEIGEKLLLDSGTLTPILQKMQKLELIDRKRSPQDDRLVQNFLTTKAKRLKAKMADLVFDLFCNSGIGAEDANNLIIALKAMAQNLIKLRETQNKKK